MQNTRTIKHVRIKETNFHQAPLTHEISKSPRTKVTKSLYIFSIMVLVSLTKEGYSLFLSAVGWVPRFSSTLVSKSLYYQRAKA